MKQIKKKANLTNYRDTTTAALQKKSWVENYDFLVIRGDKNSFAGE